MREYSLTTPHKAKDFAAMTKLNNVKCLSVEPELIVGGEQEYATTNLNGDVLCKLMKVGSQGGFRYKKTKDKKHYAYIALESTGNSLDWIDIVDRLCHSCRDTYRNLGYKVVYIGGNTDNCSICGYHRGFDHAVIGILTRK